MRIPMILGKELIVHFEELLRSIYFSNIDLSERTSKSINKIYLQIRQLLYALSGSAIQMKNLMDLKKPKDEGTIIPIS